MFAFTFTAGVAVLIMAVVVVVVCIFVVVGLGGDLLVSSRGTLGMAEEGEVVLDVEIVAVVFIVIVVAEVVTVATFFFAKRVAARVGKKENETLSKERKKELMEGSTDAQAR